MPFQNQPNCSYSPIAFSCSSNSSSTKKFAMECRKPNEQDGKPRQEENKEHECKCHAAKMILLSMKSGFHQMRMFPPLPYQSMFIPLLIGILTLIAPTIGQNTGKCYSFAPGLTIPGGDYRRDYGLSRRQCADVCKSDVCCMAFEWHRTGGQCTLKSRSLNGTVVQIPSESENQIEEDFNNRIDGMPRKKETHGDVFFALCLDYGDSERDRFWDHELGGPVVANLGLVGREKCSQLCGKFTANGEKIEQKTATTTEASQKEKKNEVKGFFMGLQDQQQQRRRFKRPSSESRSNAPAVIYSWRSVDPTDMESPLGECQCISVLQHIRLSFGSFAGFLL